jgi:thiamine biosynthesis protein ThiI
MGEIFLKGDNRPQFISALVKRVRYAVKPLGGRVESVQGRIFVHDLGENAGLAERRVSRIFGVHSLSHALEVEKEMPLIEEAARELSKDLTGSFRVSARRADKRFPLDSMQLNALLGGVVLESNPALTVDVKQPEHTLTVEIREKAYLHMKKIPAVGGMPVGTDGKALLLLSGGIDSPVAGYQIAKRGVELSAIHYHSFPFTSEQAKQKVLDLAAILAEYTGPILLHVVPFTRIQQEIYDKCPESQTTILMRRFMMRIADRVAKENGCEALVTGESIGQVASQTLQSLLCTNAVCSLPVFRPLIGADKTEIMDQAQRIGSYATSILPFEDCCTIFTPRHPVTRPRLEMMEESEAKLDVETLVEEAIRGIETLRIRAALRN